MSNISENLTRVIIDRVIKEVGKSYCEISGDLLTGYTNIKKLRKIAACMDMADTLEISQQKTLVYQHIASKYDLSDRYVQSLPQKHPQYFKEHQCVEFIEKKHKMFRLFGKFMEKTHSSINYDLCLDYTDIKIINRIYACLILREKEGQPIDKQLINYIKGETTLGTSSIKHLKTTYPQHFKEARCF